MPNHPTNGVNPLISHWELDLEREVHVRIHRLGKNIETIYDQQVRLQTNSLPGNISGFSLYKAGDFATFGIS